jgi:hypothetical protein
VAGPVKVKGLRELVSALRKADKRLAKDLRKGLREAAVIVQRDAAERFASIDARSAAGFRPRVRGPRAAVEQRLRRTTGQHPDFGALQMRRALMPALDAKAGEVEKKLEDILDRLGNKAGF